MKILIQKDTCTPRSMLCYAKSLQLCLTLCDPIDSSPPGSPIPGILQARTLEWVAISFSNAWKWKMKAKSLSRVQPSVTPWTGAYQAPLSLGFSTQEYWSGVPLPSPPRSIEALFKIAKKWKQSKCPLTEEWIQKKWYIYTMKYFSAIKSEKKNVHL